MCGEDRLSELPDELLLCILTRLPSNEAARTSVLSRRWEKLWTLCTILNFDGSLLLSKFGKISLPSEHVWDWDRLDDERYKFVEWVNCFLDSHQAPVIEEFNVRFDLNEDTLFGFEKWVRFAVKKNTKSLKLDFSQYNGLANSYRLNFPPLHKLCSSMHGYPSCNSLTSLNFSSIRVSGKVIEYFIYNCTFLESVVLKDCESMRSLRIVGWSLRLKYLEIVYCYPLKIMKISDTNLVSLKLWLPQQIKLTIDNVPNLVELSLENDLDVLYAYCHHSRCFSCIQKLHLRLCLEPDLEFRVFPEFTLLKELELAIYLLEGESLLGVTSLMEASPVLERFSLKLTNQVTVFLEERDFEEVPRHPHKCLKVVELVGSTWRMTDIEFLFYLLQNAVVLEKIIYDPRTPELWSGMEYWDIENIGKRAERAQLLKTILSPKLEKLVIVNF